MTMKMVATVLMTMRDDGIIGTEDDRRQLVCLNYKEFAISNRTTGAVLVLTFFYSALCVGF